MPAAMEFHDIRRGSDLEFGQSIYEPFGIAQVEPVAFGALACVTNVCGCVGFVERAARDLVQQGLAPAETGRGRPIQRDSWSGGRREQAPVIAGGAFPLVVADYVSLPEEDAPGSVQDALAIDQTRRDEVESRSASDAARRIFERLPSGRDEVMERVRVGAALAQSMSWDTVVDSYFLPGLMRICR